ncbi:hypothetical protein Fleli_0171 [Bernardetia litoralis DSM 6794]|uniref:Uncharacterized protein n=1 Tax=Bernardetia litoralis (strain ATCC 23117 / DSM 6794 / NBRC 15988 / NCIMB 1366 / Fx l1 / Sio-4) TaxID=880071 RepID=I4AFD5_BERLS|nr:hypothetical protein [Bernardetia litoralis]AFM02670.1 hypothetical protein Fleli_0171 [Bernardetia litoralis DSM 6794]
MSNRQKTIYTNASGETVEIIHNWGKHHQISTIESNIFNDYEWVIDIAERRNNIQIEGLGSKSISTDINNDHDLGLENEVIYSRKLLVYLIYQYFYPILLGLKNDYKTATNPSQKLNLKNKYDKYESEFIGRMMSIGYAHAIFEDTRIDEYYTLKEAGYINVSFEFTEKIYIKSLQKIQTSRSSLLTKIETMLYHINHDSTPYNLLYKWTEKCFIEDGTDIWKPVNC